MQKFIFLKSSESIFKRLSIVFIVLHSCLNSYSQFSMTNSDIEQVNKQSLGGYTDSISNILINQRAADGSISKNEKFFNRWHSMVSTRSYYPGVQSGGDLNWKSGILPSNFSCLQSGPSNAVWENIDVVPTSDQMQNIGVVWEVAPALNNSLDVIYLGTVQGGLWRTDDAGLNWTNKTDQLNTPSLGISSIAVDPQDPNHIIAATLYAQYGKFYHEDYKMLISYDGGDNWSFPTFNILNVGDTVFFSKIKFNPLNPLEVVACGGNKIYMSQDGGNSWDLKEITFFHPKIDFSDIEYSLQDTNIIMVSSRWNYYIDSLTPVSSNTSGAQVYVTEDGGDSWSERTPPNILFFNSSLGKITSAATAIGVDVTPAAANRFYCTYSYHNGFSVVNFIGNTSDNGLSWNIIDSSANAAIGFSHMRDEFEVSNNDSNVFYIGINQVFKKEGLWGPWRAVSQYDPGSNIGNGPTTGQFSTHADIRALVQLDALSLSDILLMGNDGGIAYTADSAHTWHNINGAGLSIPHIRGLSVSEKEGNIHYGATHVGGKVYRPIEATWGFLKLADGEWSETAKTSSINYSMGYSAISRFHPDSVGSNGTFIHNSPTPLALENKFHIDPTNESKIWYGINNLTVYCEDEFQNNYQTGGGGNDGLDTNNNNGGLGQRSLVDSWEEVLPPTPLTFEYTPPGGSLKTITNPGISTIQVAPSDSNIIFVAMKYPTWGEDIAPLRFKLMRSETRGRTGNWTDLSQNFPDDLLKWTAISDIVIDPFKSSRIWVSCNGYWIDNGGIGRNRVLYSDDMGETWVDMSQGLPPYPVNSMDYYEGSNDLIFAGTDAGVYYWDAVAEQWNCYNNGLPDVWVSKVEINYCQNALYVGTWGRGAWKAPIAFDTPMELSEPLEIFSDTTWIHDNFVPTDIVVKNGASLTISDSSRVLMASNRTITVEKGGQLIVNQNSEITNGCALPWRGIKIEGDITLNQTPTNQGRVLLNYATISNSKEGVALYNSDEQGNIFWNTAGGYVQAQNAHFINNWRSVSFLSYSNYEDGNASVAKNNISRFKDCNFEWNDEYDFTLGFPYSHMTMYQVEGVLIEGCNFSNDMTNLNSPEQRGIGIKTIDASYFVKEHCPFLGGVNCQNKVYSKFNNLNVGIQAQGITGISGPDISYAKFNNNVVGVALLGSNLNEITFSEFDVSNPISTLSSGNYYGVYSDGAYASHFEANTFNNTGNLSMKSIYTNNGSLLNNTTSIYRNTFTDPHVAVQTQGYNGQSEIDCNSFNRGNASYFADIYHANGTLMNQGQCLPQATSPTANKYFGLCDGSAGNYQAYRNPFVFYNGIQAFPFEYNSYPSSDVGVEINSCFGYVNGMICQNTGEVNLACPTIEDGNDVIITLNLGLSMYSENNTIWNNLQNEMIIGDDIELYQDILSLTIADWQLKIDLQEGSPYLSEGVLNTLVNSTRPDWMVNEILQLNYPVSDKVVKTMNDRVNPYPDYMVRDAFVYGAPIETNLLASFFKESGRPDWVIKEVALANSPLADNELIAILESTSSVADWVISDIFINNTPLSSEVQTALNNRIPILPTWILNNIANSSFEAEDPNTRFKLKSELEVKQSEATFANTHKLQGLNTALRVYKDSLNLDSIYVLLENDGSIEASCAIVPIASKSDVAKVNAHIVTLRAKANDLMEKDAESKEAEGLNAFCDFYQKMQVINSRQGGIYALTEHEIDYLQDIAEGKTGQAIHAKLVLLELKGINYNFNSIPLDFKSNKKSMISGANSNTPLGETTLMNYPDPHDGNTTIVHNLLEGLGFIVLRDVSGRKIKSIRVSSENKVVHVSLSELNTGIYFYSLEKNGVILATDKMVIE